MEDRSWIFIEDRANNQHFKECLNDFLEFAYKDKQPGTRIFCPCRRCKNSERLRKITVFEHVMIKGFLTSYNNWIYHGEEPWESSQPSQPNAENIVCDDIQGLIHEALGTTNSMSADYDIEENFGMNSPMDSDDLEEPLGACDEETQKFFKLLKHAEIELYPGCKSFTLLSFVIKLLHVKTLCRWSNNSMIFLSKQNRKSDEPFILASQAQQVWYVQDPVEPEWNVVVKMTPRDLFDVNPEIDMHVEIQDEHSLWQHVNNDIGDDGNVSWVREGVEGVTLESGETSYFIEDDEHSSDKDDFESDNVEDDKSDDDDFFEEAQQGDDDND